MSLLITKPGLLDTIQDLGRYGYAAWGINPSGVMDHYAARVANFLVGNEEEDPVIEMHFPAAHFEFQSNALIAITGADFTPFINNEPMNCWQPYFVPAGSLLHFGQLKWGSRCYMSVRNGFDIPEWLGSYSSHIIAKTGGFKGRRLLSGDELQFKEDIGAIYNGIKRFPWRVNVKEVYQADHIFRFIKGREWEWLNESGRHSFEEGIFIIQAASDRMAYTLVGPSLPLKFQEELVSSGVYFGTVQLLPDGRTVLLMADHQTTGGFPRLAHVVSSELPRLAQMRPGENIRFDSINQQKAEELVLNMENELLELENTCSEKLNSFL